MKFFFLGATLLGTAWGACAQNSVSPNEIFPNGDFQTLAPDGQPEHWGWAQKGDNAFETSDSNRALKLSRELGGNFSWEAPGRAIGGAEYVFSFRVKGENLSGQRLALWNQLPAQHEPPGGAKFTRNFKGTFDWRREEVRFQMPRGITRWVVFFDGFGAGKGTAWFDDFSLRPVDDAPLELDLGGPSFGDAARETLAWIWSAPGFEWRGANMNKESVAPVPPQTALFRRVLTLPSGFSGAQAVFTGDDHAELLVNGKAVGDNEMWQNIARFSLDGLLKAGRNEVVWRVHNAKGPAGLLGRIEWKTREGKTAFVPTNGAWETSTDNGKTWKNAAPVALPVPALAQFAWAYPHLPKLAFELQTTLPAEAQNARLAIRSTGGFRVLEGETEVESGASVGVVAKSQWAKKSAGAQKLRVIWEDIAQPPRGQAILQIQCAGRQNWETLPFSGFKTPENAAPKPLAALYPARSWPVNIGAFEAAATRPAPDLKGRLEPWAQTLLRGSKNLFQLGKDDDSSAEFGAFDAPNPRGLEFKTRPEHSVSFAVPELPANGAALVLDIEDADSSVQTVGVFLNGILCGTPQILGYDQVPGRRQTQRAWVVTIPKERFQVGQNTLSLRLLPSYYAATGQEPENQAQEIIQQLNLRPREESPYPTSAWLHFDTVYLAALAQPARETINGRPVWMGTNMGYTPINAKAVEWWNEWVLRDFAYLGMAHTGAPIRFGIGNGGQFNALAKTGVPGVPDGQNVGEFQLSTLRAMGLNPYLILDAGRDVAAPQDVANSHEARVLEKWGRFFQTLEVGNEVDNPYYGWDALKMASAYATIQRQSAVGQMLKSHDPDGNLQVLGEGWYHAWDFGVMDAQQRQESASDPAFTDALSAHDYGKSYIIPAVIYHQLYGANAPKPIWVTECGSYTPDDQNIGDFDLNLRGNLAFASQIVQYLAHPYNGPMGRFSLFSAQDQNAKVLEKARSFRRLMHAFAQHGAPLAWNYAEDAAMRDKLVLVRAVDAGKAWKIAFVNFSHEMQPLDVSVLLPKSGEFSAMRYGDGETVEAGTRKVTLQASPAVRFQETLAPGETVEYLIER